MPWYSAARVSQWLRTRGIGMTDRKFGLLETVQVKPLFPFFGPLFASRQRREAAGKTGSIGKLDRDPRTGKPQYVIVTETGDMHCLSEGDLDHPPPSPS